MPPPLPAEVTWRKPAPRRRDRLLGRDFATITKPCLPPWEATLEAAENELYSSPSPPPGASTTPLPPAAGLRAGEIEAISGYLEGTRRGCDPNQRSDGIEEGLTSPWLRHDLPAPGGCPHEDGDIERRARSPHGDSEGPGREEEEGCQRQRRCRTIGSC